MAQTKCPLAGADADRFYGSGVYAISYKGAFAVYRHISRSESPIYVSKADPADPSGRTAAEQGDRLSVRLIASTATTPKRGQTSARGTPCIPVLQDMRSAP